MSKKNTFDDFVNTRVPEAEYPEAATAAPAAAAAVVLAQPAATQAPEDQLLLRPSMAKQAPSFEPFARYVVKTEKCGLTTYVTRAALDDLTALSQRTGKQRMRLIAEALTLLTQLYGP